MQVLAGGRPPPPHFSMPLPSLVLRANSNGSEPGHSSSVLPPLPATL